MGVGCTGMVDVVGTTCVENVDVGMGWVAVGKVDVGMRAVEMSGKETVSVELLDVGMVLEKNNILNCT